MPTKQEVNCTEVRDFRRHYDFDQLIRIDENNWAYYLSGLTHMKLANSQYSDYNRKAINDFTKSIELNSTSVNGRSY